MERVQPHTVFLYVTHLHKLVHFHEYIYKLLKLTYKLFQIKRADVYCVNLKKKEEGNQLSNAKKTEYAIRTAKSLSVH